MYRRTPAAGLVLLVVLGVTGCGILGAADTTYRCHDQEVSLRVLTEARTATELGPNGQAALKGQEVRRLDDLSAWRIVEESDTRVALIRALDAPHRQEQGRVFTHEFLAVERFGTPGQDGRPGWHMRASSHCDLRKDLGGLRVADVTLDPVVPPGRDARKIRVLVTERGCASGQRADGRVRLIDIEPTATEIRLVIGVEPRSGNAQTCQGNPPTPFTVELDEPLGGRVLIDASVYPPQQITGDR
ncbi:hypothetical protein [Nonomuraea sp. NEAU-A123]|uniref:hypothetical protein n=1 Tax=Nonomuraea sp. NEAU-A123 TaxID=2839649 RepID=UPI001BE497A8|nr:hypothetical protein [Nonomuraea sp. NEAU-A123]MBT2229824.1 hypothetical protein [Nonomuraea sp. NEAU-A123]